MLAFSRKRALISIKDFSPADLLDDLGNGGFEPLIYSFKKSLLDKLDLKYSPDVAKLLGGQSDSRLILGDVFFPEKGVCCYVKATSSVKEVEVEEEVGDEEDPFADPGDSTKKASKAIILEVGEFAPIGHGEGRVMEQLTGAVESSLGGGFMWEDVESESVAKIKGKSIDTPSERDIELAAILRDPRLAGLLDSLKEKEAIVVDELLNGGEDAEELEYFIDKLFEAEFLSEEIVIYDDESGQPIMRAKDRAALKQLAIAGIRSPSGKPIEDLVVKRMAVIAKDNGHKMSPTWAAGIFLTNNLFKVGLSNKDVQVMHEDKNEKLVYCDFDGLSILFMLSDNMPNDSLVEHGEKVIDQLGNVEVVIFSEQEIGQDFVDSVDVFKPVTGVTTITSLENMNSDLASLLGNMRTKVGKDVLTDINQLTSVDIAGLVFARLEE